MLTCLGACRRVLQISGRLTKKPTNAADADALHKFVTAKQGGLQNEVLRLIGQFVQEYQSQ